MPLSFHLPKGKGSLLPMPSLMLSLCVWLQRRHRSLPVELLLFRLSPICINHLPPAQRELSRSQLFLGLGRSCSKNVSWPSLTHGDPPGIPIFPPTKAFLAQQQGRLLQKRQFLQLRKPAALIAPKLKISYRSLVE